MIKLENIHKWFGNLEVLRGIDLNVTRGEVVVVIGPSGSGKSTLLRVINYLEPFQEGTIYLNDQPVFQHHRGGRTVRDSEKTIREIRARIETLPRRVPEREAAPRLGVSSGLPRDHRWRRRFHE